MNSSRVIKRLSVFFCRYHVPRSWLKPTQNLLVVFEELGGDPSKIHLLKRSVTMWKAFKIVCTLSKLWSKESGHSWRFFKVIDQYLSGLVLEFAVRFCIVVFSSMGKCFCLKVQLHGSEFCTRKWLEAWLLFVNLAKDGMKIMILMLVESCFTIVSTEFDMS